jgi:hypothetical protein
MTRRAPLVLLGSFGVCIAIACGSTDPNGNGANNHNGDLDGAFINQNGDGANGEGGTGPGSGNCSAPVDMYIMFDRSGSMHEPQDKDTGAGDCNIGQTVNSKWCKSINALSGYFNSQGASGQAAALQFFPLDSQNDNLCKSGDQYNVAAAPGSGFAALPSNSFDALLNQTSPPTGGAGGGLGTPTEAAIRGLTRFTAGNRRGGRVTIGILITDGDPNGCDERLGDLSGLLDAHYKATQIRTYVIGMTGASFDNLEKIAVGGNAPQHPDVVGAVNNACGGGNGPCRAWNVGDGDPTVFGAALAAIQESADGCKDGGGFINPIK